MLRHTTHRKYEATIVSVHSVVWFLVKNLLISLNRHLSFILYGIALLFCIQYYFSNPFKIFRHFLYFIYFKKYLFLRAYIQRDISGYMNI